MSIAFNNSFQFDIKQWVHFPEELDKSLRKAKTQGEYRVGSKAIKVSDSDTALTFLRRIIEDGELRPKDIRKLMKISSMIGAAEIQGAAHALALQKFCSSNAKEYQAKAQQFSNAYFTLHNQIDEKSFEQFMEVFLRKNECTAVEMKVEFAKALALEMPALLYFALPYLVIPPPEKSLLVKLAICTPFSKGLPSNCQKQILSSISIGKWLERFRVKSDGGQDNIRGLLGYMTEQLRKVPEFQPIDAAQFPRETLRFLHYVNGVLKYGVVCRNRAKALGIFQVSSLDKQLRDPNEVEVNCIKQADGIKVAVYHQAKGAITVATERREDKLVEKVLQKPIEGLPGYYQYSVEDPEALRELSERAHHCLLLIGDTKHLLFKDNDGKAVESNDSVVTSFMRYCKETTPFDGCAEVKINRNLAASGFKAICLSDRFKRYEIFLAVPNGVAIIFVETIGPGNEPRQQKIYFGYRDTRDKDNAKVCPVAIPIPNFSEALEKISDKIIQEPDTFVITHVSKGKCKFDPD